MEMGLILLALAFLAGSYAALLVYNSWSRREYARATNVSKWLVAGVGVYLVVLLAFSLLSQDKTAAYGEEVRFCGLDPDCDLSASVIQIDTARTLGNPPRELPASGMFHLITLKLTSKSGRSDLDPVVTGAVVDARGRSFGIAADAQRLFELARRRSANNDQPPALAGTYRRTLVFDLPEDMEAPTLVLKEGEIFERVLELFVIGDEASMFHGKTGLPARMPERPRG